MGRSADRVPYRNSLVMLSISLKNKMFKQLPGVLSGEYGVIEDDPIQLNLNISTTHKILA